jgi:uncharacterized protein
MRRVRVPAAAAAVLLLLVRAAWAQAGAAAPPVDPDVQHLLELTGNAKLGQMIGSMISTQILQQVQRQHPEFPARAVDIIQTTLDEEMKIAFGPDGTFTHDIAGIWSKHFTHDEILGLIAFYETPLGKKVVEAAPAIAQEAMQRGITWGQDNGPALSKKVQDRLRAEGLIK